MKSSIAKGIIGNGLAQIVLKVIRILDQLLLVPFFLTAWGAEYYGEWLTLSIIPTILEFADFGIGSAAGNSFVLAYTAGDKQKAANIRKSGIIIISCTIIVGVILTTIILSTANYFKLFDKTIIPANEATIALTLIMIAKLMTFSYHLIVSFFRSARKAVLGNLIYSGYFAGNLVAGICAIALGCNIVGYAFSQFIIAIIFTTLYFIIGNRMIDLTEYRGYITSTDIKSITHKGFGYMLNMVWQSIYFQGSTFVVRVTLGAESVAIFNTMRTACRSINQIFNIINGSVFPELQYAYGKGEIHIVHRLFRISILTSIIIGILGTTILIIFGLDIYNIWTNNTLSVSSSIWYTFCIGILFNGIWWTSIVAYSATNNPYNFAIPCTITSCLSVVISYILSRHFGLYGAVLGVILFDVIMMIYVLPDSAKLFGLRISEIFCHIKEDLQSIKNSLFKKRI